MARRFRDRSLIQLTLVRFREFIREPEAVFWVFVFPILLAAGLGIAFRNRPAEVQRIGILSSAPGAQSYAQALGSEKELTVELLADSDAAQALRTGRIALLLVPGRGDDVEYRFDDTRPEARSARMLVDQAVQRWAGRTDPVNARDAHVHERGSRYIDFVLPGLLGMNLMGSGIWGLGFAIVDARRRKLLKRLVATPMSRVEYLSSFLLSRLIMLVLEVAILIGFGVAFFGVPLRGSLILLGLICLVSALSFSALGLLIASRSTTMEGASGLMNLVMLPMWVFSGVFFNSSNFPEGFQPFIQVLPLTAVNDALRANMLQGAGWGTVAPEMAIVLGWMVLSFVLALRMFRWR